MTREDALACMLYYRSSAKGATCITRALAVNIVIKWYQLTAETPEATPSAAPVKDPHTENKDAYWSGVCKISRTAVRRPLVGCHVAGRCATQKNFHSSLSQTLLGVWLPNATLNYDLRAKSVSGLRHIRSGSLDSRPRSLLQSKGNY